MEDLGKNIKLMRQEKGWSQGDFAGRIGISVPAFSKIENGLTDLHLSRLEHIAKILNMSVVDFLSFNKEAPNSDMSKELIAARETIKNYTSEILNLQKQVIVLHEEMRSVIKPKSVTL